MWEQPVCAGSMPPSFVLTKQSPEASSHEMPCRGSMLLSSVPMGQNLSTRQIPVFQQISDASSREMAAAASMNMSHCASNSPHELKDQPFKGRCTICTSWDHCLQICYSCSSSVCRQCKPSPQAQCLDCEMMFPQWSYSAGSKTTSEEPAKHESLLGAEACAVAPGQGTYSSDAQMTTMMIRHLPCKLLHNDITEALHEAGFDGTYEFVHVPCRKHKKNNLGYAFVHFKDTVAAERFASIFSGYQFAGTRSNKICEVSVAHIQS